MRKFEKNCVAIVRQDSNAKAIQKSPEASKPLPDLNKNYPPAQPPLPNACLRHVLRRDTFLSGEQVAKILEFHFKEVHRENKRQTSVLCNIYKAIAGLCKFVSGNKQDFTPSRALFQNVSLTKTYAFLINENGKRPLTKIRYEKIRAHADRYDMFIDGCAMQCFKRDEQGGLIKNTLRPTGFALLKEYIENSQPMSLALAHTRIPNYLKKDESTALRYFHDTRAQVDFKECRGNWKCFKNISGKAENTVFQFAPPDGFKYCLIIPMNWA
jgi:hypothetical protein